MLNYLIPESNNTSLESDRKNRYMQKTDLVLSLLEGSKVSVDQLLESRIGPLLFSIYHTCCERPAHPEVSEDYYLHLRGSVLKTIASLNCQLLKKMLNPQAGCFDSFLDDHKRVWVKNAIIDNHASGKVDENHRRVEISNEALPDRKLTTVPIANLRKTQTSPLQPRIENESQRTNTLTKENRAVSTPIPSPDLLHQPNDGVHLSKREKPSEDSLVASEDIHEDKPTPQKSVMSIEKIDRSFRLILGSPIKRFIVEDTSESNNKFLTSGKTSVQQSAKSSIVSKTSNRQAMAKDLAQVKMETDSRLSAADSEKGIAGLFHSITVKYEHDHLPKIRKKVCRKLYQQLSEELGLSKNLAKTIAMNLEFKLSQNSELLAKAEKEYLKGARLICQKLSVIHYHLDGVCLQGLGIS